MTETYAPETLNGHVPPELPRVEFGKGKTQSFPHEWAAWILTEMREDELAGRKPRPFSAYAAAAAMAAK